MDSSDFSNQLSSTMGSALKRISRYRANRCGTRIVVMTRRATRCRSSDPQPRQRGRRPRMLSLSAGPGANSRPPQTLQETPGPVVFSERARFTTLLPLVCCEPVSKAKFPVNRENYREYSTGQPVTALLGFRIDSWSGRQPSLHRETPSFLHFEEVSRGGKERKQGILALHQGNNRAF